MVKTLLLKIATLIVALTAVSCVYVDEAYRVDWLEEHIGPVSDLPSNGFFSQVDGSGDTTVTVYSSKNVLASINATNGELLWRRVFDSGFFTKATIQQADYAVLGSGKRITVWEPVSGNMRSQELASLSESVVINSLGLDKSDPQQVVVGFTDGSYKGYNLFTKEWSGSSAKHQLEASQKTDENSLKMSEKKKLVQRENGQLQLVSSDDTVVYWTREEGLAEVTDGVFFDLPEVHSSLSAEELIFEEHADVFSAYLRRANRHLNDLKFLPDYLVSKLSLEDHHQKEQRDEIFGFTKLFIAATKPGRLIALNTASQGVIEWTLDGVHAVQLANIDDENVYVLTREGTVLQINGTTGEVKNTYTVGEGEFIQPSSTSLAVWNNQESRVVNIVNDGQASSASLYLTKAVKGSSSVSGYFYQGDSVIPTWQFDLGDGYQIADSAKRGHQVVASIGTILGDRSVLYKYLHENSIAIAAYNAETKSLKMCVLDTVSGRILHCKEHRENVVNSENIHVAYGEHWVVYSYYSANPTPSQKLVVWDMYESEVPNERVSDQNEGYSSFEGFALPHVKSQSFLLSTKVKALGISQTKFGITSRDVIVSLSNGQILSLPKRLLDARRPVGRDPTKEEQGEGLVKYEPYIGIMENAVISHHRQVIVNSISTTGATLESTSLVIAYGDLDVFFTRITPSQPFDVLNSKFGKTKLLYTIVALIAAVTLLRPIVNRKSVNALWR